MCGLPGAGKTTRARQIVEAAKAVHLSPDEWIVGLGVSLVDYEFRFKLQDCMLVHAGERAWGGPCTLPDFDGQQWKAMLPPTLRAIFAPDPPKPRQRVVRPKPLAVINAGAIDEVMAKLAEAKAQFPDAVVRSGHHDNWGAMAACLFSFAVMP